MAKSRKVSVQANTAEASFVAGAMNGMSVSINTNAYIDPVLKLVHAQLEQRFELWIDALAAARPKELHHVYEWGQLGQPNGRLWESVLRGRGRERVATIIWKASKKASPVPEQLLEPGPTGKSVKPGVHIFYWKAPVMESGARITVRPQLSDNKTLAFVGRDGNIKFRNKPMTFTAGGGMTTGRFTAAYQTYWNTIAVATYNTEIAPRLQRDLQMAGVMAKAKGMSRNKISLGTDTAAFDAGMKRALKVMAKNERTYIQSAAARRAFIYGN